MTLTSGIHSDAQGWASECPDVKNYKWRLNPVWRRMLYSCAHMATLGIKGLTGFRQSFIPWAGIRVFRRTGGRSSQRWLRTSSRRMMRPDSIGRGEIHHRRPAERQWTWADHWQLWDRSAGDEEGQDQPSCRPVDPRLHESAPGPTLSSYPALSHSGWHSQLGNLQHLCP